MYKLQRIANNPFLLPNKDHAWEAVAAFNPCLPRMVAPTTCCTEHNHSRSRSTAT